jgi:hypothetical protein
MKIKELLDGAKKQLREYDPDNPTRDNLYWYGPKQVARDQAAKRDSNAFSRGASSYGTKADPRWIDPDQAAHLAGLEAGLGSEDWEKLDAQARQGGYKNARDYTDTFNRMFGPNGPPTGTYTPGDPNYNPSVAQQAYQGTGRFASQPQPQQPQAAPGAMPTNVNPAAQPQNTNARPSRFSQQYMANHPELDFPALQHGMDNFEYWATRHPESVTGMGALTPVNAGDKPLPGFNPAASRGARTNFSPEEAAQFEKEGPPRYAGVDPMPAGVVNAPFSVRQNPELLHPQPTQPAPQSTTESAMTWRDYLILQETK